MDDIVIPGSRARIGLISPTVLEVIPCDFYRIAPEGVSLMGVTCGMHGWSRDDYAAALAQIDAACAYLGQRGVAHVVLTGSPLVVSQEHGFAATLLERMRAASGASASTTIESAICACAELGVSRLAVVSPFVDDLNAQVVAYLERAGIAVTALARIPSAFDALQAIPPASIRDAVGRALAAAPASEAVFLPCGQMNSGPLAAHLEAEFHRPVLAQNDVDFWHAFREAGLHDARPGQGVLLDRLRAGRARPRATGAR